MLFWGAGTKESRWSMPDGRTLVVRWKYSHLFWCPIAYKICWFIFTDKRSEDREITYGEVARIFPTNTPHISHWQRLGGYYLIAVIVFFGMVEQLGISI